MSFKTLLAGFTVAAAAMSPAHAIQIFDLGSINSAIVQNFDDAASYNNSTSRVQIGASLGVDLGVTAAGGTLNFGAPIGLWALGNNGYWSGASFAGVDGDFQNANDGIAASLFFDFGNKTVQSVGAFLNYDDTFTYGGGFPLPLYMAAYDANNNVIEDAWFTVSTPDALDDGAFFGLDVGTASIAKIEISAPYAVVDNFAFSAPVPEPETYAMFLAGLGLLGAVSRKKQR